MLVLAFFRIYLVVLIFPIGRSLIIAASEEDSFVVTFQSNRNEGISIEEWVEYIDEIPALEEFTACHWEYIEYFNDDLNSIWSYCTVDNKEDTEIKCTQIAYKVLKKYVLLVLEYGAAII